MADDTDTDHNDISGKFEGLRERTRDLTTGSNTFAKAITTAFAQGATGAKSFDSVLKSLALRLSSLSLNLALKPLTGALTGGLDKLFSGIFSSAGGETNLAAELTKGAAQPMAKGGVIAAPTYFPLGSGRTGLAGEAGPEAIMPLARGPDGRLGVAASGGAAQHVTVNIATPDAESFRRSETYLTGLIARAVARGQRGL
jgi:phage-related minor tail protein